MLIEREIIRLYKWLCCDLGPVLNHALVLALIFTLTGHFSYNHASDVDQVDGAHVTNDTMDPATVWRGALYEGHYAADATVWPRRTLRAIAYG